MKFTEKETETLIGCLYDEIWQMKCNLAKYDGMTKKEEKEIYDYYFGIWSKLEDIDRERFDKIIEEMGWA